MLPALFGPDSAANPPRSPALLCLQTGPACRSRSGGTRRCRRGREEGNRRSSSTTRFPKPRRFRRFGRTRLRTVAEWKYCSRSLDEDQRGKCGRVYADPPRSRARFGAGAVLVTWPVAGRDAFKMTCRVTISQTRNESALRDGAPQRFASSVAPLRAAGTIPIILRVLCYEPTCAYHTTTIHRSIRIPYPSRRRPRYTRKQRRSLAFPVQHVPRPRCVAFVSG